MQAILQAIATSCGLNFTRYQEVYGGDINKTYCLHTAKEKFFLKLNDSHPFPAMFEKEAEGLEALRGNSKLGVPEVIKYGVVQDKQWLLLQWVEKGAVSKNAMQNFGTALACMHRRPQQFFGWHSDNYIGRLQQVNTQYNNWPEFYTHSRIMPLVKILFDKHIFSKQHIDHAAAFCKQSAMLFPEEPPALLHGDLWGGNYLVNTDGAVVIFDPAVYYGHREMDLGMTKLFGGFSEQFYEAYHDSAPLENGWQQRLPLMQLYPLLVHAVLFGGHYILSARDIMRKF